MHSAQEIRCKACEFSLSHPQDICPVCGNRFYWLVIPKHDLSPANREAFIQVMVATTKGATNGELLTHGGRIWLPHCYWEVSPEGVELSQFDWISELRCIQHSGSEQHLRHQKESAEPKPWDTNPSLQVVSSAGTADPEPESDPVTPLETVEPESEHHNELEPIAEPEPEIYAQPTIKEAVALPLDESMVETRPQARPRSSKPKKVEASGRDGWFLPVMMFLFFLFLAISWMVMLVHKNTQPAPAPESEVSRYEHTVLP